jgi:hypothetical protein
MYWYQAAKLAFLDATHLSKPSAHFLVGLLVFLGVLLLARKRFPYWVALTPVFAAAFGMELLDLIGLRYFGEARWADSVADIAYTVSVPTVVAIALMLASRHVS